VRVLLSKNAVAAPFAGATPLGAAKMGRFDRRNSMKMKRRKAQVKKKERVAKRRVVTKKAAPAATPAKRASRKKESSPAPKPAS
jgi:hypothetical protein